MAGLLPPLDGLKKYEKILTRINDEGVVVAARTGDVDAEAAPLGQGVDGVLSGAGQIDREESTRRPAGAARGDRGGGGGGGRFHRIPRTDLVTFRRWWRKDGLRVAAAAAQRPAPFSQSATEINFL